MLILHVPTTIASAPILGDPPSPTPEPPNVTAFGATSHTSQTLSAHSVVAGQRGLVSVSVLGEGQEVTNLGQDKQPYPPEQFSSLFSLQGKALVFVLP